MSHYTLKSFVTLTPQELLQQYFKDQGILVDYDWQQEFDAEKLAEAVSTNAGFQTIQFDFRTIHEWANERGIESLIDEARSPMHGSLELSDELKKLGNEHACVMHIFLKYPNVFFLAIEIKAWEYRKGKKHHYVGTGLACEGEDEKIRESLGNAIADYYKKQNKGKRCTVEYYKQMNPVRHLFFANPEDNVKGYRRYVSDTKIVRDTYVPVFQVVFEYNEEDGDLAIHAKGKIAQKKMYDEFCTKVLGYKEPPNAETEVFDLSPLRDGNFRFAEDPSMPVESITLRMVIIELPKGANQRITLEASPYNGNSREVEKMMGHTYMAHDVKPENVFIRKAKIEIVFKPVNMQKMRPITFIIGAPQYSELSNDEKSEKAKKYLRKWGLLKKHKPTVEAENAA